MAAEASTDDSDLSQRPLDSTSPIGPHGPDILELDSRRHVQLSLIKLVYPCPRAEGLKEQHPEVDGRG